MTGSSGPSFSVSVELLLFGAGAVLTLVAANITDVDAFDPPDNLPANVSITVNVDAAPAVTGVSPPDTATQIG